MSDFVNSPGLSPSYRERQLLLTAALGSRVFWSISAVISFCYAHLRSVSEISLPLPPPPSLLSPCKQCVAQRPLGGTPLFSPSMREHGSAIIARLILRLGRKAELYFLFETALDVQRCSGELDALAVPAVQKMGIKAIKPQI